jgi:hypothetical protein
MGKLLYGAAVAAPWLLAGSPVLAQTLPPCCQAAPQEPARPEPTPYLIGRVSADGSRFVIDGGTAVELMVTQMQAGEVPQRVDLRRYRGRHVILLCQPWFGSETAWGCEAIRQLAPTIPLRTRRP